MTIDQLMIFLLGVPAFWLVSRVEPWRRWGFIFGLLAQPFWYYSVIKNQQWGILGLNICYTYCWLQGIYLHFITRKHEIT